MIDETAEEIEEMRTHSSSIVAIKAARALEELLEREYATVEEFERAVEQNSKALRRANPSHASMQTTQRDIVARVTDPSADTVEAAKDRMREAIDDVVNAVEEGKSKAAENAISLLPDGSTILTHDYSSTVLEAIEGAIASGAHLTVYVTEARPRYLGRKTARRLAGMDRVEATLITDSASGFYLPECDRVLVGMDCIVDDTLYNRVGTFPITTTAKQVGVPVSVIGSGAKIVDDGFRFENDFRSGSEVLLEPAEGFAVENPAYDATPVELLDSIVTDSGIEEF